MKELLDFKKIATILLLAAAGSTAGAYIDVQLLKSKFETVIDDVKLIKSDISVIKNYLLINGKK